MTSTTDNHPEPLLLARIEDEIELRIRTGMDIRNIGNESAQKVTIASISSACSFDKLLLHTVEVTDLPDFIAPDVRQSIVESLRQPLKECMPILSPVPITAEVIEQAANGRITPTVVIIDAVTSRRAFLTGSDIKNFVQDQIDRSVCQTNIRMVDALDEQRQMIDQQRQMLQLQKRTIDQLTASHAALQAQVDASRARTVSSRLRSPFRRAQSEKGCSQTPR